MEDITRPQLANMHIPVQTYRRDYAVPGSWSGISLTHLTLIIKHKTSTSKSSKSKNFHNEKFHHRVQILHTIAQFPPISYSVRPDKRHKRHISMHPANISTFLTSVIVAPFCQASRNNPWNLHDVNLPSPFLF